MPKKSVKISETSKDNSFGVVGVVLGILSILFLSSGGIVLGIIGLVFSLKQKKLSANSWSKAGAYLNIIGIILGIIALVIFFIYPELLLGGIY